MEKTSWSLQTICFRFEIAFPSWTIQSTPHYTFENFPCGEHYWKTILQYSNKGSVPLGNTWRMLRNAGLGL